MSIVDEYIETLTGSQKQVVRHMYSVAHERIPAVQQETKYGMPALTYKGKGVVAVIANRNFISLYPFCNIETLGVDVGEFETTKGSIHFSPDHPLPDELIERFVKARLSQIDSQS